jgi:cytosine/adenosine deaminase-related metal-dependent hydrolase
MSSEYELIVRNASLDGSNEFVDIGIADETIEKISEKIDSQGEEEVDCRGSFVSPGFVDCHMHIDRAYAACGERVPKRNDERMTVDRFDSSFEEYYSETTPEKIEQKAVRNLKTAVASGTTHIRSHISIDHPTETENMRASIRAVERASDIVDVQLVPMASNGINQTPGSEDLLEEAIKMGIESEAVDDVLVGGADPANRNRDVESTLESWFNIAKTYDIGIDLHIQDGGTLGNYTLEKLLEHVDKHGYDGRVTASHSFALAHLPDWMLDDLIESSLAKDLKYVTCYSSTRSSMPIKELIERGVTLGHGTDNDQDFVIVHGGSDILQAALIEVFKLHGDRDLDEVYREYETNQGLELVWDMVTNQGADVLDIQDSYGIEEGSPADLVVFDEPSPQWSIIRQASRSYVIKGGNIVARDGEVVKEFDPFQ